MRSDFLAAFVGTAIVMTAPAVASPTTFTYQGHLAQDGTPSDGAYEFEIRLLDNLGVQIGMTQTASEIVTAGSFSMQLDFGNGAFDSNERYLEISVRSVAEGGPYTTLSPNQLVTSAPIAQFALSGNEGPVGPVGSQGNPGAQGDSGTPGADGADGGQGPQGDQGNDGADGAPGPQGNPGAAGTPGDSHWTLSGSNTYRDTGFVGFGTNDPLYPVHAQTNGGRAIFGENTASSGTAYGVYGVTNSSSGRAILGLATSLSGTNYGMSGQSNSSNGRGVFGVAAATSGTNYGVYGESNSSDGRGVFGWARLSTGTNYGVRGKTSSSSGYAGYFEGGRNYFEGNVGVGTTNPTANLHISSAPGTDIFRVQRDGATKMLVNANGGVSLGTYNPTVPNGDTVIAGNLTVGTSTHSTNFALNVSGTAGKPGGGSWSIFSDERLKKNITSMTGSLDTISALRPVNFEYKSEDHFSYLGGVQRGFIAQEVQKVIPQWVNTADDGYFYLDQVGYEALIVDAIQELRAEKDVENQQLKDELVRLRAEKELEIQQLEARLDRLERMMILSVDR